MKDQRKSSCGRKSNVARGAGRRAQGEGPGRAECRIKGNKYISENKRGEGGVSRGATNYHTNKLSVFLL